MISNFLKRLRAHLVDAFTYESGEDAADAMADATRWGWVPALSGVAVGAGHARQSHTESLGKQGELSD